MPSFVDHDGLVIRNAVIHLNGEQPIVVDLFDMPAASDLTLRCTNVRTLDGKRPLYADDQYSIFFFPFAHIRFIEVLPAALSESDSGHLPVALSVGIRGHDSALPPESDGDLEIDEDFLRRIREV